MVPGRSQHPLSFPSPVPIAPQVCPSSSVSTVLREDTVVICFLTVNQCLWSTEILIGPGTKEILAYLSFILQIKGPMLKQPVQ